MKRLFAVALVVTMANASTAFAGESILASGARHVQQIAATEPVASATALPTERTVKGQQPAAAFQAQGGTISKSGMSKGKKTLLYLGLAVGVAASIWTIDHNVLDVTPSSLGTRQD